MGKLTFQIHSIDKSSEMRMVTFRIWDISRGHYALAFKSANETLRARSRTFEAASRISKTLRAVLRKSGAASLTSG